MSTKIALRARPFPGGPLAALGAVLFCACALAPPDARAEVEGSVVGESGVAAAVGGAELRLKVETKFHLRSSKSARYEEESLEASGGALSDEIVFFPPEDGTSFEVSNVALIADADMTHDIHARARVHFIDLYNRNPTSAEGVKVREAWIRFGQNMDSLEPIPGSSFFVLAGRAPRFTKQVVRRLESYGLWGTAVGRFEQDQVQIGASLGSSFYVKGSIGNGNPVFLRDPNELAGDNGTTETGLGTGKPAFGPGFPILYDAFPTSVSIDGKFELGGGAGFRWLGENGRNGVDVLGWYFTRGLDESVPIRGSILGGDLDLLALTPAESPDLASPIGLSAHGDRKWEAGLNVEGRVDPLHIFGQGIYQEIAGLARQGAEIEIAYRFRIENGLVRWGQVPFLTWVEPAFRFSYLDCEFASPEGFPGASLSWDWRKYDMGIRVGLVRGVDLTAEYSRNDVIIEEREVVHPDELLVTLRVGL